MINIFDKSWKKDTLMVCNTPWFNWFCSNLIKKGKFGLLRVKHPPFLISLNRYLKELWSNVFHYDSCNWKCHLRQQFPTTTNWVSLELMEHLIWERCVGEPWLLSPSRGGGDPTWDNAGVANDRQNCVTQSGHRRCHTLTHV